MPPLKFVASVDGLGRDGLLAYVRQLDESGFDGVKCADSICYPEHSESRYPYTPSGDRTFLEDIAFLDPFFAAGAVFAATSRLRLVAGGRGPSAPAPRSVPLTGTGRMRTSPGGHDERGHSWPFVLFRPG